VDLAAAMATEKTHVFFTIRFDFTAFSTFRVAQRKAEEAGRDQPSPSLRHGRQDRAPTFGCGRAALGHP